MTAAPISLDFLPGIDRDRTQFESKRFLDAQWCRWRNGRPRKMGGYQRITDLLPGIPRKIHALYTGGQVIFHIGTTLGIHQVVTDFNGNFVSYSDRTPVGFATAGYTTGWTIDALFDTQTSLIQLIAHAVPDNSLASSATQTSPYIGSITATSALVKFSNPSPPSGSWVLPSIAGGIACVQPYLFDFDNSGLVQWSAPNIPLFLGTTGGSTGAGQARISAQKIVTAMPLRGGGTSQPAAVFWSLSEVITGSFVGSSAGVFAFSTVSPSSSILSGATVIEHDGIYYWAGADRFLSFNGSVNEVPNDQNQDWFFDNINRAYAGRAYAFKVPRYGEIWFCAPLFGNTECSHAAIFNVREKYWYDTVLPDGGRSAAYSPQGFRYPVMGDINKDQNGYKLWLNETGTDRVEGSETTPVRSYFETAWLGGPKNEPPTNKGLSSQLFEADFKQSGDMSVYLIGQANARAPQSTGAAETLKLIPGVPQEQLVGFKESHRLTRLHVESNTIGGNYIGGRNLLHVEPSEARLTS